MNPDHAARRVIVASYLYYERNSPLVSDAAFDQLCLFVAEEWEWLQPIRQFQLGSPEEIRASGSHIRITRMGEDCAIWLHTKKLGYEPHGEPIRRARYKISQPWGCLFASLRS